MSISGKIVEIFEKNDLKRGYVTKQVQDKVHYITEHGRQAKGNLKQVVVTYSRAATEKTFADVSRALDVEIEAALSEVDLDLIWEFASEEERAYQVPELAELLFGEIADPQVGALWRALLLDTCYFKRKLAEFVPRPAEQVEELRHSVQRKIEKEEERTRLRALFTRLHSASAPVDREEFDDADHQALDHVHAFLYRKQDSEPIRLIEELRGAHLAREASVPVLRAAGRIAWDLDPFLALGGVETEFATLALQHAEQLQPVGPEDGRLDMTQALTLSVDDAETREVDDAFTFERIDGGTRVGVHIADVSVICLRGDPLDEEARRRGVTVYLPTGNVTMLPERVGCDVSSLIDGRPRAAVGLLMDLDDQGVVTAAKFAPTLINVDHKLTYDQVDAWLNPESAAESASEEAVSEVPLPEANLLEAIRELHAFSASLSQSRTDRGALVLDRREMTIKVKDGEVDLVLRDTGSAAHVLVRELMIVYNERGAQLALEEGLPIIFRGQDPPDQPWPSDDGQGYSPAAADAIFRTMKPSRLSLEVRPHSSLGLEAYTQLTSPLRRYADLTLQRQLSAHLRGETPPHDAQALMEVMVFADEIGRERAGLERESKRYWSLEYLAKHFRDQPLEASVVREDRGDFLVELVELTLRGSLSGVDGLTPGERVQVMITEVTPRSGRLRFRVA